MVLPSCADVTVANPFLFRYTPLEDDTDSGYNSVSAEPQAVANAAQHQAVSVINEMKGGWEYNRTPDRTSRLLARK